MRIRSIRAPSHAMGPDIPVSGSTVEIAQLVGDVPGRRTSRPRWGAHDRILARMPGRPQGCTRLMIEQKRIGHLHPDPKSQAINSAKLATVSAGVRTSLPVCIDPPGRHLPRYRRQPVDRLRLGIAITGVSSNSQRVIRRGRQQIADFTHLLYGDPGQSASTSANAIATLTQVSTRKRHALQLERRGPSRTPSRSLPMRPQAATRSSLSTMSRGRTNLTADGVTARTLPTGRIPGRFAERGSVGCRWPIPTA